MTHDPCYLPPQSMKINNLHAVILAGGSGTRFWPASRSNRPKQFLNLVGKESLFRQTIRRIASKVPAGNIWIVTNRRYQKEIKRQVTGFAGRPPKGGVRSSQILWEPQGKNTAPAIGWAASRIHARDPRAVMVILPSDHLIQNERAFLNALEKAVKLARANHLVTFGIVPTRAETGYGYLKTKKAGGILRVERFIEKPDLARAKRFAADKNYFWNSGMFVWKTETILEAFRKYLPLIYAARGDMLKAWPKLPAISIDYGILEKARNVAAVAADIGWSDLGSWESLSGILPKDRHGNSLKGNVTALDCRDILVWADKRLVAAIGVQDLVVIDTPDALLVCHKHRSQDVKKLVETLKKREARVC